MLTKLDKIILKNAYYKYGYSNLIDKIDELEQDLEIKIELRNFIENLHIKKLNKKFKRKGNKK